MTAATYDAQHRELTQRPKAHDDGLLARIEGVRRSLYVATLDADWALSAVVDALDSYRAAAERRDNLRNELEDLLRGYQANALRRATPGFGAEAERVHDEALAATAPLRGLGGVGV